MADPVNRAHPANATILAYLQARSPHTPLSASPEDVDEWGLGTHPDLVDHFWRGITGALPEPCAWVVYGRPALVHPTSGVIFGLAGGTSTLALRLPEAERERAFQVPGYGRQYDYPGTTIYARDLGDDWALIRPFQEPRAGDWCLSAYTCAAGLMDVDNQVR